MSGSVLHQYVVANCFYVQEHTVLYRTDNMATVWWNCKGSTTSTITPVHLLQNQVLHQSFHRYLPQHEFVRGIDNEISNLP